MGPAFKLRFGVLKGRRLSATDTSRYLLVPINLEPLLFY